jgi:4-diphosphocytidyl-2-C-methyl-D-erythritol kinase
MTAAEVFAPAKVNLALHVTGRRPDGYHLIDTLVGFATDIGDRISVAQGDDLDLTVTGPMADGVPTDGENLVLQAAMRLRQLRGVTRGAQITLEKHLPHGAGLGGGSADAAATIKALARLWGVAPLSGGEAIDLGADIPMCLAGQALRARGIGERLEPLVLPRLNAVLVNPGKPLATRAVFSALAGNENPALPDAIPHWSDAQGATDWLAQQRNDLEPAAASLSETIATTLAALSDQPGCTLARMSGSGSTCFGLFADPPAATRAASALRADQPTFWVRAVNLA